VPLRIGPVADAVPAEIADEYLVGPSARDDADARIRRGAEDGAGPVAAREVAIAVAHRVALQMQAVRGGVAAEARPARSQQVQRRVRRRPAVLRLVRGQPHHRGLADALGGGVLHVRHRPRAGPARAARPRATAQRRAARRPAGRGEGGEQRRASHGRIRIEVAPRLVATCRTGGSTIVSTSSRYTRSLGNPVPERILPVTFFVFGSKNTIPLFGPAKTRRPS